MVAPEFEQRTEGWMLQRMGKVTASRVADVMATTKTGYGASRKNYMMELLCQRLTGRQEDSYQNAAMIRGTELEPVARAAYEIDTGLWVEETGLVDHPEVINFAASPDGLVGDDGLLEIKCPNTAQHVEFLRTGKIDERYQWQMIAQMACTNRNWCDFVSYDDRLPEELQYRRKRFELDSTMHDKMIQEIVKFLTELDLLEKELNEMRAAA